MDENESPKAITKIRTLKQDYERIKNAGLTTDASQTAEADTIQPDATSDTPKEDTQDESIREVDSITAQVRRRGKEPVRPERKKFSTPVESVELPTKSAPLSEPAVEDAVNRKPIDPSDISKEIDAVAGVTTQTQRPVIGDDIGDGDIITDTKKKRFKLLPAIWQSLTGWYSEKEEEIEERFTSKETVAPGKSRSDVIKQAAAQSALAPRDDYQKVSERLKYVEREPVDASPLSIKAKAEVPPPSWSYVGDEEEAPQPAPVANINETVAEDIPSGYAAAVNTETGNVEDVAADAAFDTETVSEEPTPQTDAPVDVVSQREAAPAYQAAPLRAPVSQKVASNQSRSIMPIISVVVVIALVSGIGLSVWLFSGGNETPAQNDAPKTNIVESFVAEEQQPVSLGVNRDDLLQSILSEGVDAGTTVTQIYPTHEIGPATSQEILAVLDWNAPGTFLRSIESIAFGKYKSGTPFIVLQVTSFETAFGGMLNWESDMSSDLSPLFGEAVRNTFDATANTSTGTRPAFFVDSTIGTLDIRLLKDEKNNDRIAYSLLDKQTIVITTSRAALEEIVPYIK